MSRWLYFLIRARRPLWVRTALFCLAGLAAAGLPLLIGPYMPESIAGGFAGKAVEHLLTILSSSMLAVATFSLGTMVSAHNSAASNATPRAAPLLVEDNYAQNALSTFIGVFVFSVIALVALDAGVYSTGAKFVLFITTIVMLLIVVVMLIPWVNELSYIGQMRDTLDLIETATREGFRSQLSSPFNRGHSFVTMPDGHDLCGNTVGYIQTVDFDAIDQAIANTPAKIYLCCRPGSMIHRHRPLCRITGMNALDAAPLIVAVRNAFLIGPKRTMLQDPRYGLILLAEVASRALSPGVSDPGTAIDVIVTTTRALDGWHQAQAGPDHTAGTQYPWLYANPLEFDTLLTSAFDPIIRYGSGDFTVIHRLLKTLGALASLDPALCALACRREARKALKHALAKLDSDDECCLLQSCHDNLFARSLVDPVINTGVVVNAPVFNDGVKTRAHKSARSAWPVTVPFAALNPRATGRVSVLSQMAFADTATTIAGGSLTIPRHQELVAPATSRATGLMLTRLPHMAGITHCPSTMAQDAYKQGVDSIRY